MPVTDLIALQGEMQAALNAWPRRWNGSPPR